MALNDLVDKVIGIADKVTKPLQANVTHRVWQTQTNSGTQVYGSPVVRRALVDQKIQEVRTREGKLVTARAYVAFIQPVAIGPKDLIVLPDGTTGPILMTGGFVNPATGQGYTKEVWLG